MKTKLDELHYHEVLDRLHIATDMIEDHIASHPAIENHVAVKNQVYDAMNALGRAYQMLGEIDLKNDIKENKHV